MNIETATRSGVGHPEFYSNTVGISLLSRVWTPKTLPWIAGAGIAVGHVLTSSNCSVPKQGSCSACGSCVVALGSLTAWALLKQRNEKNIPFYEQ